MRANSFSFAGLGNLLALLAVNGSLSYAFFDQLYFGELPCPLCLLQRVAYVLIGIALVLNIALEHTAPIMVGEFWAQ